MRILALVALTVGPVPAQAAFLTDFLSPVTGLMRVTSDAQTKKFNDRADKIGNGHPVAGALGSCANDLESASPPLLIDPVVTELTRGALASPTAAERAVRIAVLGDRLVELGDPLGDALLDIKAKEQGRELKPNRWNSRIFKQWRHLFLENSAQLLFSIDGLLRGFRFSDEPAFAHFIKNGGVELYKSLLLDALTVVTHSQTREVLGAALERLWQAVPLRDLSIEKYGVLPSTLKVIAARGTSLRSLRFVTSACTDLRLPQLKALDLYFQLAPGTEGIAGEESCVEFAQDLKAIERLRVSGNPTTRMQAPLLPLPTLRALSLSMTHIRGMEAGFQNQHVNELDLQDAQMVGREFLKYFPAVQNLVISQSALQRMSYSDILDGLPQLQLLTLHSFARRGGDPSVDLLLARMQQAFEQRGVRLQITRHQAGWH